MEELKIEYVDIEKIKENEYNPKKMTAKEAEELEKSITQFGIVDPLIANSAKGREGILIGGHQRLMVYRKRGIAKIPIVWVNIPDLEKERELCLRLSKSVGSWDYDLLVNFSEEELLRVGFEDEELEMRFNIDDVSDEDTYDIETKIESIKVPTTKPGDLWKLGNHRLYCGDSTKIEDLKILMDGEAADCVFTDPPYNVNYSGQGKLGGIKNDNMTEEAFIDFTMGFMEVMRETLRPGGVFYMCSGWSSYPIFLYAIKAMGMKFANPIIWVKNNTTLGWNDYRYKYEMVLKGKKKKPTKKKTSIPILYGWNGGKHYFKDTRFESDVWEIKRRASQTMIHPTQKPIQLINKAIDNSTKRGEIVLDLFGGSGGTLISCEKLNRICRVNELDSMFCDVIIDRWEQFTKEKAVKIN